MVFFQAVSGLPDSSGGERDGGHDTDSQMNSGSDADTKDSSAANDKYLHHVSKSSHSISKAGSGSSHKKASNKKARNR